MFRAAARKLFGSANDRRIRSFQSRVNAINALEKELEKLSDDELRARTAQFRKQVAEGTSLDAWDLNVSRDRVASHPQMML